MILQDGHIFVPFAPFPAIALMPLVAIIGPQIADQWETGINAALAAATVGLAWWFTGRANVRNLVDRFLLVVLFGFSTQIWWITTRGGVWHTGQLIATILTLLILVELWGKRRAWLIGLLAGAAFLTRAPLVFAIPFYALLLAGDDLWEPRRWPWARWIELGARRPPVDPVLLLVQRRPLRLAARVRLRPRRPAGLAGAAAGRSACSRRRTSAMNVDYLFTKLPVFSTTFPFFQPDGLGMSIFFTSPGLLYAVRAPWRTSRTWWLAGAALLVLIPTLLYYGGGWLQFGYRYALDSIPFVWALCALAAARDERRRESVGLEGRGIGTRLGAPDRVRRAGRRGRRLLGVPPVSDGPGLGDAPEPAGGDPATPADASTRAADREARIRRLVPVLLATWFIAISAMRLVAGRAGRPRFRRPPLPVGDRRVAPRPGPVAGRPGRCLVRGAAAVPDPDDPVRPAAGEPRGRADARRSASSRASGRSVGWAPRCGGWRSRRSSTGCGTRTPTWSCCRCSSRASPRSRSS